MMLEGLPPTVRAAFCYLMQTLYIDGEPLKPCNLINYTRVRLFNIPSLFLSHLHQQYTLMVRSKEEAPVDSRGR